MALVVAELKAMFTSDTSGLKRGEAEVAKAARSSATAYDRSAQAIGRSSRASAGHIRGMVGGLATMAGVGGIVGVIKKSTELEQAYGRTMNLVQASTSASAGQMRHLSALAMKMGADTQFSANDAADAMLELGKAGISTSDIYGGALKGTLLLAAAGGTDLGTAATIASNAMNTFNLRGSQMGKIAAALAGGANASSASVESLGQGLQQVGPGAKNAGLSLQETVATLSAFDAAGIKGSDAGTSLKTMLTNLIPSTVQARGAMDDLGLTFVNADGSFRSITNIAQQLHDKLGPLSEAQRSQALATIFGSDASRAASVLMNEGAKGLSKYIRATKDQTAAQKMADASMKGTAGSMERMRGAIETTELKLGTALAPTIRKTADWLSNKGAPAVTKFIDGMQKGEGAGGKLAHELGLVVDAGKKAAGVAKDVYGAWDKLPDGAKKLAIEAGIAYGILKKMGALKPLASLAGGLRSGGLGGAAAKASGVTPVFVTNPGFGKPGLGGLGAGGAAGAAEKASKWNMAKGAAIGVGGPLVVGGLINHGVYEAGKAVAAHETKGGRLGTTVSGGGGMSLTGLKAGRDLVTDTKALAEARKKAAAAAQQQKDSEAALTKLLFQGSGVRGKTLSEVKASAQALSKLPKRVATRITTPGAVTSIRDVARLTDRYNLTPKQIGTVMKASGIPATQRNVTALTAKYRLTPKQVSTLIRQSGGQPTKAMVDRIIAAARTLNGQRPRPKISASDGASGTINSVLRQLSALDGKTARTYITTVRTINEQTVRASHVGGAGADGGTVGLRGAVRRADGGSIPAGGFTVPGQRHPYGDKLLTFLAPGEEVISNRHGQADKFRPLLKLINAGRLADGGTAGAPTGTPLELLEAQRQIRDLLRDLNARKHKTVGKGKKKHSVATGYATTGLDRDILNAQLAEARKELARLQAPDTASTSVLGQFRGQLAGGLLAGGATSASQLAAQLVRRQATNEQWASMLAGLAKAKVSKAIIDELTAGGPSQQALKLGQSIAASGGLVGTLNGLAGNLGKQGDAYAQYATGASKNPGVAGPLVKIENFHATPQQPISEVAERLYFFSRVRR